MVAREWQKNFELVAVRTRGFVLRHSGLLQRLVLVGTKFKVR